MRMHCSHFRAGHAAKAVLFGAIVALSACSRQPVDVEPQKVESGRLKGTVTFNGQPVTYGYVVVYPVGVKAGPKDVDLGLLPVGFCRIKRDGAYEVGGPVGPVKICLVTNPDVPVDKLLPKVPKPGDKQDADKKLVKKTPGSKKDAKEKLPGEKGFNPATFKMTAEEKDVLREIHSKYSDAHRSPISFVILPKETDFDIELPYQQKGRKGKDGK